MSRRRRDNWPSEDSFEGTIFWFVGVIWKMVVGVGLIAAYIFKHTKLGELFSGKDSSDAKSRYQPSSKNKSEPFLYTPVG